MELTLQTAQSLVDHALATGRDRQLKPLAIVVLDAGGHIVVSARQDGATFLRHDIAAAKAWSCLALGGTSRDVARLADDRPGFFASVTGIAGGRLVAAAGGVPIRSTAGALLGSIGVSGDTSDNDEQCALRALELTGLPT